jgi:hypothetical protein
MATDTNDLDDFISSLQSFSQQYVEEEEEEEGEQLPYPLKRPLSPDKYGHTHSTHRDKIARLNAASIDLLGVSIPISVVGICVAAFLD